MMTKDRISSGHGPGDAGSATTLRDREHGFAAAVAMAFRPTAADLPDDMRRLLARLN